MGSILYLDLVTGSFESGMPRLVPQSASLCWRKKTFCGPLLTLPMDGTFSLEPAMGRFVSGILIQVVEDTNCGGIPELCFPLLTLLMDGTSSLDLVTGLFGSGIP